MLSSNESIGYPQDSLLFYTTEIYRQGFQYFKTGYASAMAWLMFAIILLATIGVTRGATTAILMRHASTRGREEDSCRARRRRRPAR